MRKDKGVFPVKIGIVGTGYWGSKLLSELKYLRDNTDDVSDIIAFDFNPNNRVEDIQYISDIHEFIEESDGVIIALPTELHFDYAKRCLWAGVPTFVEKPIALKSSEAKELIKYSMHSNTVLCVGHIYRYNHMVKKLAEFVENSHKIYYARFEWGVKADFEDRDLAFDLLPHIVDMILEIFDSDDVTIIGAIEKDGVLSATLSAAGVICEVHIDWRNPVKTREVTIVADDCHFTAEVVKQEGIKKYTNGDSKVVEAKNNAMLDEIIAFVAAIKGHANLDNSGFAGWKTVEIIEEIKRRVENV